MLNQLYELSQSVVDKPVDISRLRSYGSTQATPSDSLDLAIKFASLVCRGIDLTTRDRPVAIQGAADLFAFIRDLPAWLRESVATEKTYPAEIPHAWLEPDAGDYIGFCSLIQDVWEHVFGPEAKDDPDIENMIVVERGDTVLDFGCGAGHFAISLARKGAQVDCVEANRVKLDFLKVRVQANGLSDVITIGQGKNSYNVILAANVLDHLERPDETVRELITLLAPAGRFIHVSSFVGDGWHQTSEDVQKSLAHVLLSNLELTGLVANEDSFFEVLRNVGTSGEFLARPVPAERKPDLVPRLHPAVRFEKIPGEGERYLVYARRFYVKPSYVDEHGLELLRMCEGKLNLADICDRLQVELEEVWPLLEFQWSNRVLGLRDGGT